MDFARLPAALRAAWGGKRLSLRQQRGKARKIIPF